MRLRRKRVLAAARQDGGEAGTAQQGSGANAGAGAASRAGRWGDAFAKRFAALSPREQIWVEAGASVLLLALLVSLGVVPAWRSLQQAPARQQALNAQVARVAALQAQAQAMQLRPHWRSNEAAAKLQAASLGLTGPVGSAAAAGAGGAGAPALQLSLGEQQVRVTLRALPADVLATWLATAREQTHAVPTEVRLTREAASPEGRDRWSGTLVMRLPP